MKKSIVLSGALACLLFALTGCNSGGLDDRFHVKYLAVQTDKDGYWSIIDSKGNYIVREEYAPDDQVSVIYGDVYWVRNEDGYQLYSVKSPKMPLTDKVYDKVTYFNCGRAAVAGEDEPIEIINEKGKVVCEMPDSTTRVYAFSNDGLAIYQNESGAFGYVDVNGKIKIPAAYKQACAFNEGLALVWDSKPKKRDKNKIKIIDTSGKVLGKIDGEKYALIAQGFSEGKLPLYNQKSTKVEYVDSKGEVVLTLGKDKSPNDFGECISNQPFAYSFQDGYAVYANPDGKYGLVDGNGDQVIRPKYMNLLRIDKNRYSAVIKNGDSYVVDHTDARVLDYDGKVTFLKLGDYYIATPDDEAAEIIRPDGKSAFKNNVFEQVAMWFCDDYAEYINVGAMVAAIAKLVDIAEFDGLSDEMSVSQVLKKLSLNTDPSRYARRDNVSYIVDIDPSGRIDATAEVNFDRSLVYDKTHGYYYEEEEDDRYGFSDANVSDVVLDLEFNSYQISSEGFCEKIVKALKRKGFEDRGTFNNGIKVLVSDKGTSVLVNQEYGNIILDYCFPRTTRNVLENLASDDSQGSSSSNSSYTLVEEYDDEDVDSLYYDYDD